LWSSIPELRPQWLGRLPYRWAWRLQHLRREAVIAGHAPEALWLLEHPSVITTGRRAVADLPDAASLKARGIGLEHTERGGLATWHGPGQLVGYLIIDAARRGIGVRRTVRAVEQGILDWLASQDIDAHRRDGYPGVWVGRDKVCAIGMHFRRGVSMHGFALNLDPDLSAYDLFVPCGIRDGGVTSMARLQGSAPAPVAASEGVGVAVASAVGRMRR